MTKVLTSLVAFLLVLMGLTLIAFHEYKRGTLQNDVATNQKPTTETNFFFYRTIGTSPSRSDEHNAIAQEPGYVVEIGTEYSETEAVARLQALKSQGVEAYYSPFNLNGRVLFRIRSGSVGTSSEAALHAQKLKSEWGIDAAIVVF